MLWSIYKTALTKFGMLVQILTMLDILTTLSAAICNEEMLYCNKCFNYIEFILKSADHVTFKNSFRNYFKSVKK